MKKLLFSAIAMVAFAGSAFASNEVVVEKFSVETESALVENTEVTENVEFVHNCYIALYNSRGVYLDTVVVTNVPDNVPCSSQSVHQSAVYYYVNNQYILAPGK